MEYETSTTSTTDYNSMTKAQLQELLTERGISWTTAMLKADLVALAEGSE